MTQPKVKSDIESRVKIPGDTMTGPLLLGNGRAKLATGNNALGFGLYNDINNPLDEYRQFRIVSSLYGESIDYSLLLLDKEKDKEEKVYKIYHQGFKPSAADIGAISSNVMDRILLPNGSDFTTYFNNAPAINTYGSYYISGGDTVTGTPDDTRKVWWFFNKTPNGFFASDHINSDKLWYRWQCNKVYSDWYEIIHTGNYSNYALPLTGGTLNGNLIINGSSVFNDTLIINAHNGNYGEGVRFIASDGQWVTLALGATNSSVNGGTNEYCWSIHRKADNNFCISRGSSDGVNGLVMTATGMGLGTMYPNFRLHVIGDISADGGWLRTTGMAGWYNDTYSGGIHMSDPDFVRVYNGKIFHSSKGFLSDSKIVYGIHSLQYFNISTSTTSGASVAANPYNNWFYHIVMNHGNSSGYYGDQAWSFHTNEAYYRRIVSGTDQGWVHIWLEGNSITSAIWNDYAEHRESNIIEPGYVLMEKGDDTLIPTEERLSHFCGISSDTWGFSQGETDKAKTPIAVAGRVLAYTYKDRNTYKPGDCVCAAPGGTVSKMTRQEIIEWPDRIVGKVSCVPDYETWGGGENADREPVKVDGRIWIQVK